MLLYLKLPPFPSLDNLWSNLAETRRVRRRLTHPDPVEAAKFASYFGWNEERRVRELRNLRLREKLIDNKIKKLTNRN